MRRSFKRKNRALPLYIDSVGYDWLQEPIKRSHGYPYIHWLHTIKGEGTITIEGKIFPLKEHQGILINASIPHDYQASQEGWTTAYFTFGGALSLEVLTMLGIRDYLYVDEVEESIDDFIHDLSKEKNNRDPYYALEASGNIYDFLMKLKKYLMKTSPIYSQYDEIVAPIINYLEAHYEEEIKNEDLDHLVSYSTQYMSKIFKEVYHMSPYQCLMEIRIRKAKELLANDPHISIQDVCERTGFHDASYFITMFKKSDQMTPKVFRKLYYQNNNE